MNGNISEDNDQFYTGFYKARVDNNGFTTDIYGNEPLNDPTGTRNRVQVRVVGIHSFTEDEADVNYIPVKTLPWAEQCGSIFGGFGSDSTGVDVIPEVGSYLWIFFENNNVNKPVYIGSVPGNNDVPNQNGFLYNIKTKSGTNILINDNINSDVDNKDIEISIKTIKGTSLILSDKDDSEKIDMIVGTQKLLIDNSSDDTAIKLEDGGNGNTITMDKDGTKIIDSNSNEIEMASSGITVKGDVTMTGGSLTTKGSVIPNSSDYCYNTNKVCLFAGTLHGGSKVSGT